MLNKVPICTPQHMPYICYELDLLVYLLFVQGYHVFTGRFHPPSHSLIGSDVVTLPPGSFHVTLGARNYRSVAHVSFPRLAANWGSAHHIWGSQNIVGYNPRFYVTQVAWNFHEYGNVQAAHMQWASVCSLRTMAMTLTMTMAMTKAFIKQNKCTHAQRSRALHR